MHSQTVIVTSSSWFSNLGEMGALQDAAAELDAHAVCVESLPVKEPPGVSFAKDAEEAVDKALAMNPDLLLVHRKAVVPAALKVRPPTKLVATVRFWRDLFPHSWMEPEPWAGPVDQEYAQALLAADAVVVPSPFAAKVLHEAGVYNTLIVPSIPRSDRSHRPALRQFPAEHLIGVVGTIKQHPLLADLLGKLGVPSQILLSDSGAQDPRFHGIKGVDQMSEYFTDFLHHTTILLAPTRWAESFGRALFMAQLAGVPTLASHRGAHQDLAAFTLPLGEPQLWESVLRRWVEDPDRYHAASSACSKKAGELLAWADSQWTWRAVHQHVTAEYPLTFSGHEPPPTIMGKQRVGSRYRVPHTLRGRTVGIGLCTYGRSEAVRRWCDLLPFLQEKAYDDGLKLQFVVSSVDAEPPDYPETRGIPVVHGKNLGVAWAKNRALNWLSSSGCDHFFLIEDDCMIDDWGWFVAYVLAAHDTGAGHLMYGPINESPTWEQEYPPREIGQWKFQPYQRTRDPQSTPGVVTFLTREVLEQAGGLDCRFVGRGHGHREWTDRIYRITDQPLPHPLHYLDIPENGAVTFNLEESSRGWNTAEIERNAQLAERKAEEALLRPDLSYLWASLDLPELNVFCSDAQTSRLAAIKRDSLYPFRLLTLRDPADRKFEVFAPTGRPEVDLDEGLLQQEDELLFGAAGYRSPRTPISVCISLKNRAEQFVKFFAAFKAWARNDSGPVELVVADFESDDCDVEDLLYATFSASPSTYVPLSGPFSRARGLHAAAQAASHDLLCFLDVDILVRPEFGVRARMLTSGGAVYYPQCYKLHRYMPPVILGDHKGGPAGANGYWCRTGHGLMVCDKETYRKTGGWDRSIGRWGAEDTDLHWYVQDLGIPVRRYEERGLIHMWHPDDKEYKEEHVDKAMPSLAGKWKPPVERGAKRPDTGDRVVLRPAQTEASLGDWTFHITTVRQFMEDMDLPARDTDYFKGVKTCKANGGTLWRDCRDDEAIVRRVERLRKLYEVVREEGFDEDQPVQVKVGPRGELKMHNGHHRGGIAVAMGLPLPAEIIHRHATWIRFVDAAFQMAFQMYGRNKLYQCIDHPEFSGWKVERETDGRVEVLDKAFSYPDARSGEQTILDIGACQGGVSFGLGDLGYNVTAAEINDKNRRVGEMWGELLRRAPGKIRWEDRDGFEVANEGFDWIICLSVLHHVLKTCGSARVGSLIEHLDACAKRGIVVEFASGEEGQMEGTDAPGAQDEMLPWLYDLCPDIKWSILLPGAASPRSHADKRWMFLGTKPEEK